jgi:hypothetical protein
MGGLDASARMSWDKRVGFDCPDDRRPPSGRPSTTCASFRRRCVFLASCRLCCGHALVRRRPYAAPSGLALLLLASRYLSSRSRSITIQAQPVMDPPCRFLVSPGFQSKAAAQLRRDAFAGPILDEKLKFQRHRIEESTSVRKSAMSG